MRKYSFSEWKILKEQDESKCDPFVTLQQKQGDVVYFGIHDLSKAYKKYGALPKLNLSDIQQKQGEIIDADPVDQAVKVAVEKAPYHYGYRKLEGEKEKMRRYMRDDGKMEVKIQVSNLQEISHLVGDGNSTVWLVIDGNTKYQKDLMREIRRKEVERANSQKDMEDFSVTEPEEDIEYMHVAHFNPSLVGKNGGWKYFTENRRYDYYPEG